jgi:hypothetical protein
MSKRDILAFKDFYMMLIPLVLFWVLILFSRSILGWKGALLCISIWFVFLIGFNLLGLSSYFFVGFQALFDIVLIMIIMGGDIQIR